MRRCTKLHCVEHATEFGFDHVLPVSSDGKRLVHDFREVVSDSTRTQFDTIAHDIILECFDLQRIVVLKRRHAALWHRKRIVREFDFPDLLVFLEHREVDNPDKLERAFLDQAQRATGLVPRLPGKLQSR